MSVVISSALVLDPVETGPDHPLIGWQNIATAAGVTASGAAANYPASNLANPATHPNAEWRGAGIADTQLNIASDGLTQVDYVAIARHNFGSAQIQVAIGASILGVATTISPLILPADDSPLLFRFSPLASTQFTVTLLAGLAAPRAAVLYAGKLLIMQKRLYAGHVPLPQGRRATISNGMSESGNFLGRVVLGAWRETTASFRLITPDWHRANTDPFFARQKKTPFFFAWRPASYPREVGYGWLTNDPQPTPQPADGNLIAFDLAMSGIA